MAFFDKISSIAKNAADKTGDMIEITKLNSRISDEKAKITSLKNKIGEYYWNRFMDGEVLAPETIDLCNQIKDCNEDIAKMQAEIQQLKKGSENLKETEAKPEPEIKRTCSACGTEVTADNKFCSQCGMQLE